MLTNIVDSPMLVKMLTRDSYYSLKATEIFAAKPFPTLLLVSAILLYQPKDNRKGSSPSEAALLSSSFDRSTLNDSRLIRCLKNPSSSRGTQTKTIQTMAL